MLAMPDRSLTGWHVLAMMLAFFGIIFAVNGVFLYQAISTYTGVVAQEPYRKGLKYNERIEAAERQDHLGWQTQLVLADRRLSLFLKDASDAPVSGYLVRGIVGRAATAQQDMRLTFREDSPGTYSAAVGAALAPGSWLATLDVVRTSADGKQPASSDDIVYRLRRRLWVK